MMNQSLMTTNLKMKASISFEHFINTNYTIPAPPANRARTTAASTYRTSDSNAPQSQLQVPSPPSPSNLSTDGNELELAVEKNMEVEGGEPGMSTGGQGGCQRGNPGGGNGEGGAGSARVTRGGGWGSRGGRGQGGRGGRGMEMEVSTASAFVVLLTTFSMTVWLSDLDVLLMVQLSSYSSQG